MFSRHKSDQANLTVKTFDMNVICLSYEVDHQIYFCVVDRECKGMVRWRPGLVRFSLDEGGPWVSLALSPEQVNHSLSVYCLICPLSVKYHLHLNLNVQIKSGLCIYLCLWFACIKDQFDFFWSWFWCGCCSNGNTFVQVICAAIRQRVINNTERRMH